MFNIPVGLGKFPLEMEFPAGSEDYAMEMLLWIVHKLEENWVNLQGIFLLITIWFGLPRFWSTGLLMTQAASLCLQKHNRYCGSLPLDAG